MKTAILVASLLITTTTLADTQKKEVTSSTGLGFIKVCNPKNAADTLEMTVKGPQMTVVKTPGPEVIVSTIERSLKASPENLKEIEISANLKVKLSEATIYSHTFGVSIIAKDEAGTKYLLDSIGSKVVLLSTSESCK